MKNISKVKIKIKPIAKGHSPHRSGAGVMGDRRTKRDRCRSAQKRRAILYAGDV